MTEVGVSTSKDEASVLQSADELKRSHVEQLEKIDEFYIQIENEI